MEAILDVEVETENPFEYVNYIAIPYQISELISEIQK
jgi:hypothetical protein